MDFFRPKLKASAPSSDPQPAELPLKRQGRGRGVQWVIVWLGCLVFCYPAFWLANSLFNALPDLIRIGFQGYRLVSFRVSRFDGAVRSVPPNVFDLTTTEWGSNRSHQFWLSILIVLTVLVFLSVIGRARRTLSGLLLAMLGQLGLTPWLFGIVFERHRSAQSALVSIFYFVVLGLGLRWMLKGWIPQGYGARVGSLLAGFVILPALIWRIVAWSPLVMVFRSPFFLLSSGVGIVAALLVSLPAARPLPSVPQKMGWGTLAVGVLMSVVMAVGARRVEARQEESRRAANQAAMAAYPPLPANFPFPKIFFQKGVSFSAEGPEGYESERAREMLERLPRFGINAVALVPYGFERRGSTEIVIGGSLETDEGLEELSRVAHARGMKVMLKPGLWVGGGGFAGDLDFPSPDERAKWFAEYQFLVEHYARLAARIHADIFSIGGELVKLSRYDSEWRKIIARTRQLYPGPLVYAANFGEEFETLRFWDALDYIGLQEYYPLPDDLSTRSVEEKVEAVQRKYERPVIFTEAGFPSVAGANRKPWDDSGGEVSLDLQVRCYEAVFRAFYDKPWFEGVYWWKVGSDGRGGAADASHTPWGKPAMEVMARYYLVDKAHNRPVQGKAR